MFRRLCAALLISAAPFLFSACSSSKASSAGAPAPPPAAEPPVKVARAEQRTVPVEIATVGNVEAWSTISVKAQIGGTLMKVHFKEGDMVKKGDLLFEIDPRPYEEAIRQAEANIARDKALQAQAEASLSRAQAMEAHYSKETDRYNKLADQGIFSREQADQMAVQLKSARSTVKLESATILSTRSATIADESALASAKLNLAYCKITSPINGRTGNQLVKEGNFVKANDVELVTIHQIQPVYVSFAAPEVYLLDIRRRANSGSLAVTASIPGDSGAAPRGSVSFLNNSVDRTTGTIQLKGTFTNADTRLWPGQFVDVRLRLSEQPNSIVIPAAAVQVGQQGTYVYVLRADQSVELRLVSPGPRMDNVVAIQKGVTAGETVVTEGQLRLAPGMKVKVIS